MKKLSAISLCIALLSEILLLTGCNCKHEWKEADCITPKTCKVCEETEGESNGHEWKEATCKNPKTCEVCGETEGKPNAEHKWKEATHEKPKTCTICGETEGLSLNEITEKLSNMMKEVTMMSKENQMESFVFLGNKMENAHTYKEYYYISNDMLENLIQHYTLSKSELLSEENKSKLSEEYNNLISDFFKNQTENLQTYFTSLEFQSIDNVYMYVTTEKFKYLDDFKSIEINSIYESKNGILVKDAVAEICDSQN